MTDAGKIKACLDLANFSAARFEARRVFEWKVMIGLWTLLGAGTIFSYGRGFSIPWLLVPIATVVHAVWVRGMYVANRNDILRAYHFRGQAELCLIKEAHTIAPSPSTMSPREWRWWVGFLTHWTAQFEILATLSLAAAVCFVSRIPVSR